MKTFVEIGVCDFNTLEPLLDNGWEGYFAEPIEKYVNRLKDRGAANVHQCAISSYTGKLKMYQSKEPDIIDEDNRWQKSISHAVEQRGTKLLEMKSNKNLLDNIIEVDCFTLQDYFKLYNISKVDFLKVDTEGHEIDIFEVYDWCIKPNFMKVEHIHVNDLILKTIFEDQGYIVYTEERDMYAVL